MKVIYYILQFTWGLPQNIVGAALCMAMRMWNTGKCQASRGTGTADSGISGVNVPVSGLRYQSAASPLPPTFHGALVTPWPCRGSMSLGMFLFLGTACRRDPAPVLSHEFGHSLQSVILGPLYLPVIGAGSLLWSQLPHFREMRRLRGMSYYSFWPERWANRLGLKVTGIAGPK